MQNGRLRLFYGNGDDWLTYEVAKGNLSRANKVLFQVEESVLGTLRELYEKERPEKDRPDGSFLMWRTDGYLGDIETLVERVGMCAIAGWGDNVELQTVAPTYVRDTATYLTGLCEDATSRCLSGVVDGLDQCDKIEASVLENLQKRKKVNRKDYENFGYWIDTIYGIGNNVRLYRMTNIAESSAIEYAGSVQPIDFATAEMKVAMTCAILANLWCEGQGLVRTSPISISAKVALGRALSMAGAAPVKLVAELAERANTLCVGLNTRDTSYHYRKITSWTGTGWITPVEFAKFGAVKEACALVRTFCTVLCYLMNFVWVDDSFEDGPFAANNTNKITTYTESAHLLPIALEPGLHIKLLVQYGKTVQDFLSSTIEAILSALGFSKYASYPKFDAMLNRIRRCVVRLKHDIFHAPKYARYEVMQADVESALKRALSVGGSDRENARELLALVKSSNDGAIAGMRSALDLNYIDANVAANAVYMNANVQYGRNALTEAANRAFICTEMYGSAHGSFFDTYALSADIALSAAHAARACANRTSDAEFTRSTETETHPVFKNRSIAIDATKMQRLVIHEWAMRRSLPGSMVRHIAIWLGNPGDTLSARMIVGEKDDALSATRVLQAYYRVLCYLRNLAHLYVSTKPSIAEREDIVELIMPYGWTVLAIINMTVEAMVPLAATPLEQQLRAYDELFLGPRWGAEIIDTLEVDMHLFATLSTVKETISRSIASSEDVYDVVRAEKSGASSHLTNDHVFRKVFFPEVTWGTLWRPLLFNSQVATDASNGHTPSEQLAMLDKLMDQVNTLTSEAVDALVTALSLKPLNDSVLYATASMVDDELSIPVDKLDECLRYVAFVHSIPREPTTPEGIVLYTIPDAIGPERQMVNYHRNRAGYVNRALGHARRLGETLKVNANRYEDKANLASGVLLLVRRWFARCNFSEPIPGYTSPSIRRAEAESVIESKIRTSLVFDKLVEAFSNRKAPDSVMRALRDGEKLNDTGGTGGVTLMELYDEEARVWGELLASLPVAEDALSKSADTIRWSASGEAVRALTYARAQLLTSSNAPPRDGISAVRVLHQYYALLSLMLNLRTYARTIDLCNMPIGFDLKVETTFGLPIKITASQFAPQISLEVRFETLWFFRESDVSLKAIDSHIKATLSVITRILLEVRDELERKGHPLSGAKRDFDTAFAAADTGLSRACGSRGAGSDAQPTRGGGGGAQEALEWAVLAAEIAVEIGDYYWDKHKKKESKKHEAEEAANVPTIGFGWDDTRAQLGKVRDSLTAVPRSVRFFHYGDRGTKEEWVDHGFRFVTMSRPDAKYMRSERNVARGMKRNFRPYHVPIYDWHKGLYEL